MKDGNMIGSREEYIAQAISHCNRESYKAAVCDMLGWLYQGPDGRSKKITEQSPHSVRYEIRSRQHVEVYGFKTIHTNY